VTQSISGVFVALLILLAPMSSQAADESCRIRLVDTLNRFSNVLSANPVAQGSGESEAYLVTDKVGTPQAWSVRAAFRKDSGILDADAGVPSPTKTELMRTYADLTARILSRAPTTQNSQLTWTLEPGAVCTAEEASLIQFLVMEWFYFG
jgi:hypothetical protein